MCLIVLVYKNVCSYVIVFDESCIVTCCTQHVRMGARVLITITRALVLFSVTLILIV